MFTNANSRNTNNRNKKRKIKNYNIIIVPERKGISKAFKLSVNTIKLLISLFIIILITLSVLLFKYVSVNKKVSQLKIKEEKINSLEIENEQKQKMIDDYKKYKNEVNEKLDELEKVKDEIESKIKNSSTLNGISFNENSSASSNSTNIAYSRASRGGIISTDNSYLVEEIDDEIKEYRNLSKQIDSIIQKEQYMITLMPCSGRISSYFGYRQNPFNNLTKDFHPGVDIAANLGSKVYAAASGTVILAGSYGGYGKAVMIDHHNGYVSLYGHNSELLVSKGEEVKKGQLISLVGSTGSSTGPHLHFEVRKNGSAVDPLKVLKGGM